MRIIACAFALLFTLVSPASAQMHVYGGGHEGGRYHGYHRGMGGFHRGYYGGGGYHGGVIYGTYPRHFRGEGYDVPYEVRPRPYCTPWQLAGGMCGPDD